MRFYSVLACSALALFIPCSFQATAESVDSAVQKKLDEKIKVISAWGKDSILIAAIKAYKPPSDAAGMTQEKWKSLSLLDGFARSFSKNQIGEFLKSKKDETISEAFVSAADGTKLGFLTKPTSWTHKGKPKHELPMSGKTWQGEIEQDESTGAKQIQLAVPVLDGSSAVGSLVVGFIISKL